MKTIKALIISTLLASSLFAAQKGIAINKTKITEIQTQSFQYAADGHFANTTFIKVEGLPDCSLLYIDNATNKALLSTILTGLSAYSDYLIYYDPAVKISPESPTVCLLTAFNIQL